MSELNDVIIIGSGPSGYTAAIYAARAQLMPIVLEGSVTMGGALMNTTEVENFPGFIDGIMGPELMMNMRAQAERFGAKLIMDDAISVEIDGELKRVTDGSGRTYLARTIILAMGSAFRELGVPGEKRLSGHGVSWCATCDGFFFRGQTVAVIGGGDSAVEEATFLTRFADKVYLVHRRDQLRASKVMISRAEADPKIEFVWNSEVLEVLGEAKVSGIRLRNTAEEIEKTLDVTGVFVAIGHDPRNELVKNTVDIDAGGYVKVTCGSTATNVDGVFACGDLVDHSYRQAITAAGTGCSAALDAERWLSHQKDNL
jgi:thioredoxin reductase (NADPH)